MSLKKLSSRDGIPTACAVLTSECIDRKQQGKVVRADQGLSSLQEQLAALAAEENHTAKRLEQLEEAKQGSVDLTDNVVL
jgi:hypothetical protein